MARRNEHNNTELIVSAITSSLGIMVRKGVHLFFVSKNNQPNYQKVLKENDRMLSIAINLRHQEDASHASF
jgi:hypothetical protein